MNKSVIGAEEHHSRTDPFAVPYDPPRAPYVELKDSFESNLGALAPFLGRLMRLIATFTADKSAVADVEVALREALLNAVLHGNKNDHGKRVYVTCRCGIHGDISLAVRDEGMGFADGQVEGRGICVMRALMDEVSFAERGTVVYMKKKPTDAVLNPCVH